MTTSPDQSRRTVLYGGSFDPIHFGHLIAARCIAEHVDAGRIILIPSARPPHKTGKQLAPATDRLEMARLAVKGDPLFEVSDIELHRAGPSYTIDTVAAFRVRFGPDMELFWMIGADSLGDLANWHRIADLVNEVTIVTAARPAFDLPELAPLVKMIGREQTDRILRDCFTTPRIEISSTDVRERVATGRPIDYLTANSVIVYIEQRALYRKSSNPAL